MILISHRGNLYGVNKALENSPEYIDEAIRQGFDCEIDIWSIDNDIFLGHDSPDYKITLDWLLKRQKNLWVHCKNIKSIEIMRQNFDLHFFWHENDTLTLTSKGILWVYPGKQPVKDSIAVLPELNNDITGVCLGVCSDFIEKYK